MDFFKVNKILMMGGDTPPYTLGVQPINTQPYETNVQLNGTRTLIQNIQNQRGSLKHTKKPALIGALATSGAVIGGAGAAYYFSDDIIKYFNQYGKQIIKEVPIPEELLPGNNNKLPPELQTQIGADGLLSPDTILPDDTRLGNYVSPEMTEMMMSDPALRDFVTTGRLPATEIPDITIDPNIIDPGIIDPGTVDPEILTKVEEFKGMNLEFLKDPAVMGGIAGGAALAAILAVILLALVKVREVKAGEKLVEDAKKLNQIVNGNFGEGDLKEVRAGGMSEGLKKALDGSIGVLPRNEKLEKAITKLNVSAAKTSGATATGFALSGNASERLNQLIELRDQHFGQIGQKGLTTKTVARRAFDPVLSMIDKEIEETAGIIADTLSPELKGSKTDDMGRAKEGNVVKVDELAMQRHAKFMESVNKNQNLGQEYNRLLPPSQSVEQTNNPTQMSMKNPFIGGGGSEF